MFEENQLYQLYSKFPTLIAQNMKCTKYSWIREIGDICFVIKLDCPNFPSCEGIKVTGDDQFMFILKSCNIDISEHIKSKIQTF